MYEPATMSLNVARRPRGNGTWLREGMRVRGREGAGIVRVRGANACPWVVDFDSRCR